MPLSDKQPGPVRGLGRPPLEADTSNRARSAGCVVVETHSLRHSGRQLLTDADPHDWRRRSHSRALHSSGPIDRARCHRGIGIAGTTAPLWWKRSCQGTA
jgi:hypothetical protein